MNRRKFTKLTSLGALGALLPQCEDFESFPFQKNQVIGCFGDSVTYGGKNGYVEKLQQLSDTLRPDLNLTFHNWGKSSETVTGLTEIGHPGPRPYLFERLDEDLASTKIDVAFFCYGINCGIYGRPSEKLFDSFKIGVLSFLEKLKQKEISAVLLTPPPLALNTVPVATDLQKPFTWQNPYPNYEEEVLQKFKRIILDTKHPSVLATIDIHQVLLDHQKQCYDSDPIHPNLTGHRLIAETIVENLGF
ncbi:GDSL-type esterase/lipase family protein [Maribacter sp. 2307UL18-2]|uniref:GDSL-type esterase/lipase family protein n=1 Tax=Maribacter sp. 2307UL18-2 TaxID=3386274 RepID=UPI0039BC82D7